MGPPENRPQCVGGLRARGPPSVGTLSMAVNVGIERNLGSQHCDGKLVVPLIPHDGVVFQSATALRASIDNNQRIISSLERIVKTLSAVVMQKSSRQFVILVKVCGQTVQLRIRRYVDYEIEISVTEPLDFIPFVEA